MTYLFFFSLIMIIGDISPSFNNITNIGNVVPCSMNSQTLKIQSIYITVNSNQIWSYICNFKSNVATKLYFVVE